MIPNILIFLGLLFALYGCALCFYTNIHLGIVLTMVLGLVSIACGVFYDAIQTFLLPLALLLSAGIALMAFIALWGRKDRVTYTEEVAIVLGAGIRGEEVTSSLKFRLDKAMEYHRKNPAAYILVTGGLGPQESVTEAFAMEKYLLAQGVDKAKIIKEEKSTTTAENFRFSKELLDARFPKDYRIVVITNAFHIFRATAIAKHAGYQDAHHLHAGLPWYYVLPNYLRESLAVLKMLLFR